MENSDTPENLRERLAIERRNLRLRQAARAEKVIVRAIRAWLDRFPKRRVAVTVARDGKWVEVTLDSSPLCEWWPAGESPWEVKMDKLLDPLTAVEELAESLLDDEVCIETLCLHGSKYGEYSQEKK